MGIAGRLLGAGAPMWQRLEAICQEYLGAHPRPDAGVPGEGRDPAPDLLTGRPADWLEVSKEALELEMNRWDFLEPIPPVPAPVPGTDDDREPPQQLDARLRGLAATRDRWDLLLGHLAMLVRNVGLWRDAGFATFSHYCEERLGMAARTVEQRAALARRCDALPGLREAMAEGRVSYEKARLVARIADDRTVSEWIDRAGTSTCIELRRTVEASEEAQTR